MTYQRKRLDRYPGQTAGAGPILFGLGAAVLLVIAVTVSVYGGRRVEPAANPAATGAAWTKQAEIASKALPETSEIPLRVQNGPGSAYPAPPIYNGTPGTAQATVNTEQVTKLTSPLLGAKGPLLPARAPMPEHEAHSG